MEYQGQSRSPPPKKAKTKFPKVFQCSGYGDCKMTFTRSEHLARHIRKHTGERPFRCHCNRTFSRLDNLRQHIQTVHANEHHILHAPPPPPLPHSNKVSSQHEYQQQQQQQQAQQQQYWSGQPVHQTVIKDQNIIIEHNPSPTSSGPGLHDVPPQFRPKHRPNPLSLAGAQAQASPPGSPMNGQQPSGNYSPSSPMFSLPSPTQYQHHPYHHPHHHHHHHHQQQQHQQQSGPPQQPWSRSSHEQLPSIRSRPYYQHQQYPNSSPSTPGTAQDHSYAAYPYQAGYHHSSPSLDHSHGHNSSYRSTISSTASSKHLSTASSATTPISSTTNSWLSNVLCDTGSQSSQQQEDEEDEDRPHTWGPSNNNRYSTSSANEGDRNSLSQLVRITEEAHISTPVTTPGAEQQQPQNALPSLSSIFANPSTNNSSNLQRPPQLSSNRSYTKNLILPRPDTYPPKGYALPMADTRPPALPPAGQQPPPQKSSTSHKSSSSGRMNKPLPPLPAEAQQQLEDNSSSSSSSTSSNDKDSESRSGGGMDALIKAAGV